MLCHCFVRCLLGVDEFMMILLLYKTNKCYYLTRWPDSRIYSVYKRDTRINLVGLCYSIISRLTLKCMHAEMNNKDVIRITQLVSSLFPTQFGIDYSATSHPHRGQWRPLPYSDASTTSGGVAPLPPASAGSHSDAGSDREGSVKSAKIARSGAGAGMGAGGSAGSSSRRPDPVRRSASLNSRGSSYDRI